MRTPFYFALGVAFTLATACSSSSHQDEGETKSSKDSGVSVDARADTGTVEDSGVDATAVDAGVDALSSQPVFSADAGSTWTALYRDYFGNEAAANTAGCANGSSCHGGMTEDGFQASNFFCPKGNAATCYESLTSQSEAGPYLITADAGWEDDDLSSTLCEVNDAGTFISGRMPYDCVYNFTPADIARIKAWVAAGYPDN